MVSSVQVQEPVSRTDQYKRVMKPLLERKRRARINKCLDELRDLLVAALQSEGETVTRLEKADILELTVRHVRKLNDRKRLHIPATRSQDPRNDAIQFQQGFVAAAQQVQSFLIKTAAMEPSTSSMLLTHLTACASNMIPAVSVPNPSTTHQPTPPRVVIPTSSQSQYPVNRPCPPQNPSPHLIQHVAPPHVRPQAVPLMKPEMVHPHVRPQTVSPPIKQNNMTNIKSEMVSPQNKVQSVQLIRPQTVSPPTRHHTVDHQSSPSNTPPPLMDLRVSPEQYVNQSIPHTTNSRVVVPTPMRELNPVPQDLSVKRPFIKEEPSDFRRESNPSPPSNSSRNSPSNIHHFGNNDQKDSKSSWRPW